MSWRSDPLYPAGAGEAHYTRQSLYLPMRDGVQIAIDVYTPEGASEAARVPTILRQTRYWRAPQFRLPWRAMLDEPAPLARRFLAAGYAWVDVDVRGSGASGGVQTSLWSDAEVRDGGEIVEWIVHQPWSSGAVGALGDSYDGTAAEFLLANRHPAVKAIAPRFALFDGYTDVAYPGGVPLVWFTETWGEFNDAIDRGDLGRAFPWWVPIFISGPRRVDGPDGAAQLRAAQLGHAANFDVRIAAREVVYRDDVPDEMKRSIADWSPCCTRRPEIEASGAAVFSVSGWYDGAYPNAAIKRFHTLRNPGSRLLLGPWNHGGDQALDPHQPTRDSEFDHASELLRFFDFHLKGIDNGWASEPAVHYFTTGEGRWKSAASWPPPARATDFYLAPNHELARERPAAPEAADAFSPDPASGTGETSRWRGLAVPTWTHYGDRADADRHNLVYESTPLERDLEVTGHPVLHLWLRADAADLAVFAYLEDVGPDGEVGYLTEGQLRALHRALRSPAEAPYVAPAPYHSYLRADARPLVPGEPAELVVELLPVSHLFSKGHRIRLALAGGDRDQFAPIPGASAHWQVERSADAASRLELPVVPRD